MATATKYNRDALARWHAKQHIKTDPGVRTIYYLPKDAPEREIRLLEVNELIAEMNDAALRPIDFGVDTGMETEHRLLVLDVTPRQWARIRRSAFALPQGWSLVGAKAFGPK
jgi:hypothetical protein